MASGVVTQYVLPALDIPTTRAAATLVVFDPAGEGFARIRRLGLDAAIWRTTEPPSARSLPAESVVVFVADDPVDWEEIRASATRYSTLVATSQTKTEDALVALRQGAFGYVDLAMQDDTLRRTISGAFKGEPAYPRTVLGVWLRDGRHHARERERSKSARLTGRQREIVTLIAGGSTDKEIAARLGIRTATAQKHVANLLRRLGVANRAAAVGAVFKEGEAMPSAPHSLSGRRRR